MAELKSQFWSCLDRPTVPAAELRRLLGYPPGRRPDARVSSLTNKAADWYERHGRPWTYVRYAGIEKIDQTGVRLGGGRLLRGRELAASLQEAEAATVAVAAVSAGPGADEQVAHLWAQELPDESFVLDAYCSAITERLVAHAGNLISGKAATTGRRCLPHRSPGYGDWPLSDQAVLGGLLVDDSPQPLPGPLKVLRSGMLWPKKSLLAVFGLTPHLERAPERTASPPCSNCDWTPCAFRRTALRDRNLPEEMSFRQMGADLPTDGSFDYAFSKEALERWRTQHLDMTRDVSGVRAVFRFHGTTCSNLGMPLLLRYEVKLSATPDGYWIRSATCRPEPDDEGFRAMCSYLEDAEDLTASLQSDHPLEGCGLDMALEWNPRISPSGCLCKGSDRNHKWRIVLQTIHYALGRTA